jgi:hypothetical protein
MRLAWLPRKGSSMVPDSEAVPASLGNATMLVIGIGLVLLSLVLREPSLQVLLEIVTVVLVVLTLIAMFRTMWLIDKYGCTLPYRTWFGWKTTRKKLGGTILTDEARSIQVATKRTNCDLLADMKGNLDLVFTSESVAWVRLQIRMPFMAFEICGTLALGCASVLLSNAAAGAG